MTTGPWVTVVEAPLESVRSEVIQWAGLAEAWVEHGDALEGFGVDFLGDVLECCSLARISHDVSDGLFLGQWEMLVRVQTWDEDDFRAEIEDRICELLVHEGKSAPGESAREIQERIRDVLLGEVIRFPAEAVHLKHAAKRLCARRERRADAEIADLLAELAYRVDAPSLKNQVISMARWFLIAERLVGLHNLRVVICMTSGDLYAPFGGFSQLAEDLLRSPMEAQEVLEILEKVGAKSAVDAELAHAFSGSTRPYLRAPRTDGGET